MSRSGPPSLAQAQNPALLFSPMQQASNHLSNVSKAPHQPRMPDLQLHRGVFWLDSPAPNTKPARGPELMPEGTVHRAKPSQAARDQTQVERQHCQTALLRLARTVVLRQAGILAVNKLAAPLYHDVNFHCCAPSSVNVVLRKHPTSNWTVSATRPPSCPLFDSHLPPKRGIPHPHPHSLCERASSSDQTLVMYLKGSLQRSVQRAAAAMQTGPGITTA